MAENTTSVLSCVSVAPLSTRPWYVQGMEDDPNAMFDVVSLGPPFSYVIPSFDVLAVELRQMVIVGQEEGVEAHYDLFVRNNVSLRRSYPARMTVKDFVVRKKP